MFEKVLNLLRRSAKNNPRPDLVNALTDRFMQKLAEAARQNEIAAGSPNQLTVKEAQFVFAFVRDLLVDWALERYPGFDLDALKARQPETFWRLVEFGVRVEKLTGPITADQLRSFLNDYAIAIGEAAALAQEKTY